MWSVRHWSTMWQVSLLGLVSTLSVAGASADGFVDVVGGMTKVGGPFLETSPKLAVRAGSVKTKEKYGDGIISVDWTPIESNAADLSAHRFRAIGSYAYNGRFDGVTLGARIGVGLDFLKPSTGKTLIGYAFELGVFMWFAAGPLELGGELAMPWGLNGRSDPGVNGIETYLSVDLDALIGVRHVWR